jgi:hypothetical protein
MRGAPLCIDLFCGLGGWTEGFLAEGYQVIGFDIERHVYGEHRYPGELVLQDVLTLHGRQFRDAAVIVASSPCQAYSYRAMPWKRAKALPPPSNELFDACFRIAKEAGVPLIVENVKGAQPWVGRAKWHYGSFYLWGDVPALMPSAFTLRRHLTNQRESDAIKQHGSGPEWFDNGICKHSSRSDSRKAASALIAKIPFELSSYIARVFKRESEAVV